MGHDSKKEKLNGLSLTFAQYCWVMTHFWIFEKCGPTPSYLLFMTTLLNTWYVSYISAVHGRMNMFLVS